MRRRWIGFTVVAAAALVLGHHVASAQPGPQPGPPPAPQGDTGMTQQVKLTPAEELTQTDAILARMEQARGVVRKMLEAARAARDVVKTLCLNDKLNQLDVAIRSARERRGSLEAAATRNDTDLANHEYTILNVLRQRADQLSAEANQCIGQEAGFVGESAVTSTIDPGIPEEDPSQYPSVDVIAEPPACSSCFK